MKKEFQDIIPPTQNRSIRNIPLPNGRKVEVREEEEVLTFGGQPKKRRFSIWVLAVVSILLVFMSLSWMLEKAVISYSVKKQTFSLPEKLVASKESGNDGLQYAVISDTLEESKTIKGSGEKEVSIPASGTIQIFNNSTTAQKLIEKTRFETPEGLIFRIEKAVTVPAKKIVGKETVPGTIEAKVIADKPGSSYNVGLKDFTVPGFKGDPRFTAIFARSKTEIGGGSVGKVAIVDEATLESATKELQEILKNKLEEKIASEIPKDFMLLRGASEVTYQNETPVMKADGAVLKIKGSVKAFILVKQKVVSLLMQESKISLPLDDTLTIDMSNASVSSAEEAGNKLELATKGEVIVSYDIGETSIKDSIKDKSKTEALKIISGLPGVEKSKITLKPFWKNSLPKDPKNIEFIKE